MSKEKRFINPNQVVVKLDRYEPIVQNPEPSRAVLSRKTFVFLVILGFIYLVALFVVPEFLTRFNSDNVLFSILQIFSVVAYAGFIFIHCFKARNIYTPRPVFLMQRLATASESAGAFVDVEHETYVLGGQVKGDIMFSSNYVRDDDNTPTPNDDNPNSVIASPILLDESLLGEAVPIEVSVEDEKVTLNTYATQAGRSFLYDDDVYGEKIRDTLIHKVVNYQPFPELCENINKYFLAKGLQGKFGPSLVGGLFFSRMFLLKNHHDFDDLYPIITSLCGVPEFVLDAKVEDATIFDGGVLAKALTYAKNNPEKPTFLIIKDLLANQAMDYVRPLIAYLSNFNDDTIISVGGALVKIPHNLYLLTSLKEGESLFDVSRRYLTFCSYIDFTYDACPVSEEMPNVKLTISALNSCLKDTAPSTLLSEDGFRKIDNISYILNQVNGYYLNNKISNRLESYFSVYLSITKEEDEILDEALFSNYFPAAIISKDILDLQYNHNIMDAIDTQFGKDKLPKCRRLIKEYFALFDKEGNRIHEEDQ